MNNIKWKDEAVFYANGTQFREGCGGFQRYNDTLESWQRTISGDELDKTLKSKGFQLNEIRQGDCIKASELDTEQKYNDAVEAFGLFGFKPYLNYDMSKRDFIKQALNYGEGFIVDDELDLIIDYNGVNDISQKIRKITYPQLMAIGKLKRLMNECDKVNDSEKPNSSEVVMQKNKPVVAQVMIDLTERMEIGIKTYGEALRANNGRDALQDAYEEALDLACYLKQAMIERDNANNTN